MSTEKKQGTIWSYNPAKFVGSIIDDKNQRYFFHRSTILSGPPEPTLTAKVLVVLDKTQPAPGKLPIAREIEVLEEIKSEPVLSEAAKILADRSENGNKA